MTMRRYAILAGAALLALMMVAAGAPPEVSADSPLAVRFRLADGVRITGDMSAWDDEGFSGDFGRRRWIDLMVGDAWDLRRRVMDREDAAEWIALGRLMLVMDDGANHADRRAGQAFRRALYIDGNVQSAIDAARAAAAQRRRELAAEAAQDAPGQLRTVTPEAGPWRADPWPVLTDQEQRAAVMTTKADAEAILKRAALEIEPIETERFLVYSNLPRQETARRAVRLEGLYEKLAEFLGADPRQNLFWGKAVVFIFADHDRFTLIEADAFDQLLPAWKVGICHYGGPKVYINCHQPEDDGERLLDMAMMRSAVHGFLHRYKTTARLPAWANEGLADYIASSYLDISPAGDDRRRSATQFVRSGGDVGAVMSMEYDHDTWLRENSIGSAVGQLLIELMIRQRPRKFAAWVNAVKEGKDWQEALTEDYGVTPGQLADTFTRYYQVND